MVLGARAGSEIIGLLILGVAMAMLFVEDICLPLPFGVLLFWALALWSILAIGVKRHLAILSRFMVLLYVMPFGVTINYLFKTNYLWWSTPIAVQLQEDRLLLTQMVAVALIGLVGLLLGIRLGQVAQRRRQVYETQIAPAPQRTLPPLRFGVLLACAVLADWLIASPTTIFESRYASSESGEPIALSMNFSSLGVIGYILLIVLYIDAEREPVGGRRRPKMLAVLAAVGVIVIFFQLLRGDRDSLGLVVGLMALYITRPRERDLRRAGRRRVAAMWRRVRRLVPISVVIVLVFIGLGAVRQTFADPMERAAVGPVQAVVTGWENSTWTALLLTNLAQAGQYRSGEIEYLYGRTYVDYALSLPPGVLTHLVGITRPLEGSRGPNYWFEGVSAGGIHPALVPFRNFGILGTLSLLAVWGFLIARWDNPTGTGWRRLTYGAVFVSSFNWFWYGDMNIIHGLLAAFLLRLVYERLVR
jgi:hypothetical protein